MRAMNSIMSLLLVFFVLPAIGFGQADDNETQAETENVSENLVEPQDEDASSEEHASEEHADDATGGDHAEDDGHADEAHAADDHAAHDNDPTHGNLSDARWEIVDFRTDIAFFTAVVFLLLLAGLYATAWKPIMGGLEKRERRIAENIAQAEQASEQASQKLAEYEQQLAAAQEEAQQIVAEARKDAEAAGQKLIASAQEESVRLKERATQDIESAKRVALGELAHQSSDVAMSLAKRVVGREVKAEDHQGLIQEMLSKLPSNN